MSSCAPVRCTEQLDSSGFKLTSQKLLQVLLVLLFSTCTCMPVLLRVVHLDQVAQGMRMEQSAAADFCR